MPGVALNNAPIQQVSKSNHVSYVEKYKIGETCTSRDQYGNCTRWEDVYDTATHHSNAKITGNVSSPSNKFFVNGVPVACVGDPTTEQWVADPSPSPRLGGTIISISPGTSGSGRGQITGGNSKRVFLNGKLIAVQGSTVNTHLGVPSTITQGNNLVNM